MSLLFDQDPANHLSTVIEGSNQWIDLDSRSAWRRPRAGGRRPDGWRSGKGSGAVDPSAWAVWDPHRPRRPLMSFNDVQQEVLDGPQRCLVTTRVAAHHAT
jgi:hypothetical protein